VALAVAVAVATPAVAPAAPASGAPAVPVLPADPAAAAPAVPAVPAQVDPGPRPPPVTAQAWVLRSAEDDQVLGGVAHDDPRLIASTTKILTALLAIEAGTLGDEVTISAEAVATGRVPGAAALGLEVGETLPMRSLLAGLIVRSGNDAAVAVAQHVAGTEAAFVARMNTRAAELGLESSAFVDASGLGEGPGNTASPLDLALLAEVAMANPDFASWAGAMRLALPGLGEVVNRNLLLGTFPGATGVKTGFTTLAGECLVASATRDGRTLYAVVLGSDRTASFADAAALLSHGFADYRRAVPASPAAPVGVYRWAGAEAPLLATGVLATTLPAGEPAEWVVQLRPAMARPVPAGTVVGSAEVAVDGEARQAVDLVLGADVAAPAAAPPAARAGASVQEALRAFARSEPVERPA